MSSFTNIHMLPHSLFPSFYTPSYPLSLLYPPLPPPPPPIISLCRASSPFSKAERQCVALGLPGKDPLHTCLPLLPRLPPPPSGSHRLPPAPSASLRLPLAPVQKSFIVTYKTPIKKSHSVLNNQIM